MAAVHIDIIESIEIKNGVASVSGLSGGEAIKCYMALPEYRRALMVANTVLAEHDHPAKNVLPIGKKR